MKQGTLLNKIVMLIFFGAILLYLGVYAWRSLSDPYTIVPSYSYTVDDTMEATGFLVRRESVIAGTGGIVDPLPAEGEKVARGEAVAVAYQSAAAAARRQEIHALELELEQLQYAQSAGDSAADSAKLSQEVISAIVSLRSAVERGDLTRLEDQALELKSLVYKREAAFGEGDGSAESGGASIASVQEQLTALRAQAAQDTSRITVDRSGIFSGQVDGYESLLTPDMLETLTPSALDKLARQKVAGDESAVGKLITDTTWYFVCPLTEEEAGRLSEGSTVSVRFSRDWSGEVSMKVERIGAPENGRMPVILSTTRFLSDTTLLRRQTVDIVFHSQSGIRIPKSALRVEQRSVEDEETGETSAENVTGVYALISGRAEFKPVVLLDERDDYCIVAAQDAGAKKALRSGDEIIIAAAEIFDGMVID